MITFSIELFLKCMGKWKDANLSNPYCFVLLYYTILLNDAAVLMKTVKLIL